MSAHSDHVATGMRRRSVYRTLVMRDTAITAARQWLEDYARPMAQDDYPGMCGRASAAIEALLVHVADEDIAELRAAIDRRLGVKRAATAVE